MKLRSALGWSQHIHMFRLEKVTAGLMTDRTVYHFRCEDCRWPAWCFKDELWPTLDGLPT